jgi:hypothetical protein
MLDMFSLIRHFSSTTSVNSPALVRMYRKTRTLWLLLGECGAEVLLIGNKRLWLSSLFFSFLCSCVDWTGEESTSCRFVRQSELKVDIDCA